MSNRRKRKFKPEEWRKVIARVDPEQFRRLEKIRDENGFNSIYEIVQYAVACILRIGDPRPEEERDMSPIPEEIEALFYDLSQGEKHFEFVKPKRALPQETVDSMTGQLRITEFDNHFKTG